jgi:2-polyprenyl-3-methyl-5-hydroxy-6-metoxy-1,4-benzoquinol methylase
MRPSELSACAASLYRDVPGARRLLMKLRPYICPFDRLIECVPPGSRVLDVGCGAGLLLALLGAAGHCHEGVGFDVDGGAIAVARLMAARIGSLGYPAVLRFEHLPVSAPWLRGPFDVVSVVDVMHHVPLDQWRALMGLAYSSLRPGGLLLYKDIGDRPHWRALANNLHDLVMTREWVRYTPIGQVQAWAREIGFESSGAERINRLWYCHDLVVFARPGL